MSRRNCAGCLNRELSLEGRRTANANLGEIKPSLGEDWFFPQQAYRGKNWLGLA